MQKKILIERLQEMLTFEYTDVFIYNNEANLFKQKLREPKKIIETYKSFALDELTHADLISKYLSELNVKSVWEYKDIPIFNSIRDSLKNHLEREIKVYQKYIALTEELEDRRWKIIFEGIAFSEKQHIKKIIDIIQNLRH
ncbi:MAG: ferritin-like domain-containing protein [Candidatus Anstonellales archaeon]